MSSPARAKAISMAVLIVVFGAGAVVGAAFDRSLGADEAPVDEVAVPSDDDRDEDERDGGRRQAMWERVGPDETQRAVIDSLMSFYRAEMRDLQSEFRDAYNPRYWAIVDATRGSIRDVLEAEQRMQYDSLTAAYDERRRNRDDSDRGN